MSIQHEALIDLGANWLSHSHDDRQMKGTYMGRCPIILKEFSAGHRDIIPDVIGFASDFSVVIECKVSRSDFHKDHTKPHRYQNREPGNYRFFLVPTGLVLVKDIPNGWGLLYTSGKNIQVALPSPYHPEPEIKMVEIEYLYSVCRRAILRGFKIH